MHNFRVPPSHSWYTTPVTTPDHGVLYIAGNHSCIAYIPSPDNASGRVQMIDLRYQWVSADWFCVLLKTILVEHIFVWSNSSDAKQWPATRIGMTAAGWSPWRRTMSWMCGTWIRPQLCVAIEHIAWRQQQAINMRRTVAQCVSRPTDKCWPSPAMVSLSFAYDRTRIRCFARILCRKSDDIAWQCCDHRRMRQICWRWAITMDSWKLLMLIVSGVERVARWTE